MTCEIRISQADDSDDLSRLIVAALRNTNGQDYSLETIERVEKSFSSSAVMDLMSRRKVFVATIDDKVVGTASLDGRVVRTVFVEPSNQGKGIGRKLMEVVESEARKQGVEALVVPSSITAEAFYTKLGFMPVRDNYHGEERTIIMERRLE